MKVLEHGNPNGWEIEQKCTGAGNGDGGCGARLLVAEDDLFITSHTDYGGDTDYYYTFTCPDCGRKTDIPTKNIPHAVQDKVFNKYETDRLKHLLF